MRGVPQLTMTIPRVLIVLSQFSSIALAVPGTSDTDNPSSKMTGDSCILVYYCPEMLSRLEFCRVLSDRVDGRGSVLSVERKSGLALA